MADDGPPTRWAVTSGGAVGARKTKTPTVITKERNMGRAPGFEGNGTGSVTETIPVIVSVTGSVTVLMPVMVSVSETTITVTIKTTYNA